MRPHRVMRSIAAGARGQRKMPSVLRDAHCEQHACLYTCLRVNIYIKICSVAWCGQSRGPPSLPYAGISANRAGASDTARLIAAHSSVLELEMWPHGFHACATASARKLSHCCSEIGQKGPVHCHGDFADVNLAWPPLTALWPGTAVFKFWRMEMGSDFWVGLIELVIAKGIETADMVRR